MRNYSIIIFLIVGISLLTANIGLGQQNICPELEESAFLQVQDCSATASICLPVALEDVLASELTVSVNGTAYDDTYLGCDFDSIIVYSYFTLLGEGEAGPYHLDSWMINDESFSGEFPNIDALVDSMNLWDPTGLWTQDEDNPNILGGNLDNTYSDMVIEQLQLPGTYATLGLNYGQYALGTILNFPVGQHEVIITSISLDCADTIDITVACTPTEYIEETVYLGLSGTICLDDSDLIGTLESMTSCSENDPQGFVDFYPNTDTQCITYNGMTGGSESTCYVICDDLGICDTTYITINVVLPPEGEVVVETILVGEMGVECLSSEDLSGSTFTMINDCPEQSGQNVQFGFEDGSLCVEYTGLTIGMDTACIVICDELGGCDTTTFYIAVIDPIINDPLAVDDSDSTAQNETIIINITENDTVDFISSVAILTEASNGSTFITMDDQISYEPNEDFCGRDVFEYIICNATGCDTATVDILVICDEVRVYNGFSPNDDGVNDMFRIGGIESFPNCEVKVFNSWGNLVYQNEKGEGYDNNNGWDGTWNGKHLPDGNYFYLIDLKDGESKAMSGYVLIHR